MSNLPDIPSPCVGTCTIGKEDGLCQGCFRTRDEIRAWRDSTNEEKYLVVKELRKRRKAVGRVSESDLRPRRRQARSAN